MLVRTRHLVGLISGVLILSVLLPVGLSIWLAHQQVETSFIEELNTYSSRVAIRANKVATQGKDALQELERWQGAACSEAHLMEMRRVSTVIAIFRKWFISITTFPNVRLWSMKARPIPSPSQVKFRKMVIVSG